MDKKILHAIFWAAGVVILSVILSVKNGNPVNWPRVAIAAVIVGVAEYIISVFENRNR